MTALDLAVERAQFENDEETNSGLFDKSKYSFEPLFKKEIK